MKNIREIYQGNIGIRCSNDEEKKSLMQLLHDQDFRWVSGTTIDSEAESNLSIFPYYISVAEKLILGKGNGFMLKYGYAPIINFVDFKIALRNTHE